MATVERAYKNSTQLLGGLTMVLGLVLLVSTLARGGGPLALGVLLGAMFTVIGAGRLYLARNG